MKDTSVVDATVIDSGELCVDFYRQWHPDLAHFSDEELLWHWQNHGKQERRLSLPVHASHHYGLPSTQVPEFHLDFSFYTSKYKDIASSPINSALQAKYHWLKFGKDEKRVRNVVECLDIVAESEKCFEENLDFKEITQLNPSYTTDEIIDNLDKIRAGDTRLPIIFGNEDITAKTYYSLGVKFYKAFGLFIKSSEKNSSKNDVEHPYRKSAESFLNLSLNFKAQPETLELLGNMSLDKGDKVNAQYYYSKILSDFTERSDWVATLYLKSLDNKLISSVAFDRFIEEHSFKLVSQKFEKELDEYISGAFEEYHTQFKALASLDQRERLIDLVDSVIQKVYRVYHLFYGQSEGRGASLSGQDILIVGDFHVNQCIRYRIEQKIEQFASQGINVVAIDWTELDKIEHWNKLGLYQQVIFYRVPATPAVVKAIAYVNSLNIQSFYEIDDLVFDAGFPPQIDTYGGYVDIDTHIGLRVGMAITRSAIKLCQFGIASTLPLQQELADLVISGKCLLHRNGVDSINYYVEPGAPVSSVPSESGKQYIDIFYGSGTQAHNSDFSDLALPALEELLSTRSDIRLIIAGYLRLAPAILEKFGEQILFIPHLSDIQVYFGYLQSADINIAVLHDDKFNGCKSELKWFEAATLGVPSILSATQNYRDVIAHGKTALLANSSKEWLEQLRRLIDEPALREKLVAQSQAEIKSKYSVEALGGSLVKQLHSLLKPKNPTALLTSAKSKQRKKILFVNVFYAPQSIGGATRVLIDNIDVLQKQYKDDFDICVFTSDDNHSEPYKLTRYQQNSIDVYRTTIKHRPNMDWHPEDERVAELFEQVLISEKPDMIHFHCIQRLGVGLLTVAKNLDVPYYVTAHDAWWISDFQFLVNASGKVYHDGHPNELDTIETPEGIDLGQSIARRRKLKQALLDAEQVFTVSESFAEIYRKNGIENIVVNRNGLSKSVVWRPKDTRYTDKVVCAHIGGMSAHKGYDIFKEAISTLQPKNIEVLVVNASLKPGEQEITTWGKVPVRFVSYMPQAQIAELYNQIDVLFAPSIWPESYGLVTREAAACGCWVVASNVGGIGEDICEGVTGFQIEPSLEGVKTSIWDINSHSEKFKLCTKVGNCRLVSEQVDELAGFYRDA